MSNLSFVSSLSSSELIVGALWDHVLTTLRLFHLFSKEEITGLFVLFNEPGRKCSFSLFGNIIDG